MKNFILSILIVLTGLSIAQGQTTKLQRADALFKAGAYFDAIDIYKPELEKIQQDKVELAKYLYKIATCYRLIGNARQAELWYQKAIMKNCTDPKAFFYYAEMLKMGEKYDQALENYQKYKQLAPNDKLTDVGIRSCELAKQWIATPSGYEITNVRSINSKQSDYSPAYGTAEYNSLFFTSSRTGATGGKISSATGELFSDIFYTERDKKGVWSEPKKLDETINTAADEGTCSLSADFNTMFFTRCRVSKREKLGCEILFSKKSEGGWLTPEAIQIAPDSMIVAHPSLSNDGLTLYFASNIKGGFGGIDIWKMTRASTSDNWGEPINMGGEINTFGNEMFPFIHSDGTVYFSSDGQPGIGGLDIFRAKFNDKKEWTVENMRFPINSPSDDFGITFEQEREAGYFSSRRSGGRGADDIYLFYLPPIVLNMMGQVSDEKTSKPIAQSTVKLVGSNGLITTVETAEDGSFKFMLNPNTDYVVVASKKGYLNNKSKETTRGINQSKDFEAKIKLTSTEKPIEIPNIFYDYDRWELRPESMAALDKLVEILNDNPNVTIELGSHTDSRGSLEYNYELSQKRAQSVVNYLIEKGIATDRLKAKGYAQSQPKIADADLVAQYPYMTLGVALDQKFADTLDSNEKKETVYQICRRTEFKVLRTDYKVSGKE
ncbi:MAG: OmpA family protein [Bacteroidales bacterium]|nr:OmpA family protein [Bacteroidales bacterium]